eukprot:6204369-Pleurochrysis_carterae.AAC.5
MAKAVHYPVLRAEHINYQPSTIRVYKATYRAERGTTFHNENVALSRTNQLDPVAPFKVM